MERRTDRDMNGIWLVIDESNARCGITDRLKTAVGLYHLARTNGLGFHFVHSAGFDLREYLLPNETDWTAELTDLSPDAEEIRYLAPFTDFPAFRKDRQYVCRRYVGKNLIEVTGVPDWQRVWREAFFEMFRPAPAVTGALAACPMPERFTAVNIRFLNSLGINESADYNAPLPPREQERLIGAVLEKVAWCEREAGSPLVVYSDSVRFLRAAQRAGYRTCDPEGVGHIMNPGVGSAVCLGTFVYLFQMAKAERIYSVLTLEGFPASVLYRSQYPRYAAILGDRPFIRL